jgi:hypothetical protein
VAGQSGLGRATIRSILTNSADCGFEVVSGGDRFLKRISSGKTSVFLGEARSGFCRRRRRFLELASFLFRHRARTDGEIKDQRQLFCAVVLSVETPNAGTSRY